MMRERKCETRPYAPDYVSEDTLAYRLDCPVECIEALVRMGALPRPRIIGKLRRWDFTLVRAAIETQNSRKGKVGPNGLPGPEIDPFLAALETELGGTPSWE
jgi:hypothetical protein